MVSCQLLSEIEKLEFTSVSYIVLGKNVGRTWSGMHAFI